MRLLLTHCALSLCALSFLGCPQAPSSGTTAAPARGAAALLPPRIQAASSTPPVRKVVAQTVLPGLGEVAPGDLPSAEAVALRLGGEPGQGVIEGPSDRDEFTLWVPAGHSLEVEAHCYGEVLLDLRDPQGALLASGSRSLSASIAQPGTYSLSARALCGQGLHYTIVTR